MPLTWCRAGGATKNKWFGASYQNMAVCAEWLIGLKVAVVVLGDPRCAGGVRGSWQREAPSCAGDVAPAGSVHGDVRCELSCFPSPLKRL